VHNKFLVRVVLIGCHVTEYWMSTLLRARFKCVEALGRIIIRGIRPVENRVVGCWCCCLSGARCRQLSDLINSMTYTIFFIPDY